MIALGCFLLFSISQPASAVEAKLAPLVNILKDPEAPHDAKWKSVQSMIELGKDVTPATIALLDVPTDNTRYYAIRVLDGVADLRAVVPLSRLLADTTYIQRRYAATALGWIKDPAAVPALKNALSDKSYVRNDAMLALARIDHPDANTALKEQFFGNKTADLDLLVELDSLPVKPDVPFNIHYRIRNATDRPTAITIQALKSPGRVVVQDTTGRFVPWLAQGPKDPAGAHGEPVRLAPKETLSGTFQAALRSWVPEDEDDVRHYGSVARPLLDFGKGTALVQKPGDYTLCLVLEQSADFAKNLWDGVVPEAMLRDFRPLKAVSNTVPFSIAP